MDQNCDKCEKLIKHGEAYVTITREVEYFTNDLRGHDVVEVIDAESIVVFCKKCGDDISFKKIKQMIHQQLGINEI